MRDCVGNEIHVGDRIVACDGYYSELLLGRIVRFTEHQVVCECVRANNQDGDPFITRKYPNQVHIVQYRKLAVKRTFMNDSADHPYVDYYCSNCGNKETVYEDDNFCSICGSKFTTDDELVELAAKLVIQDIAAEQNQNETQSSLKPLNQ